MRYVLILKVKHIESLIVSDPWHYTKGPCHNMTLYFKPVHFTFLTNAKVIQVEMDQFTTRSKVVQVPVSDLDPFTSSIFVAKWGKESHVARKFLKV